MPLKHENLKINIPLIIKTLACTAAKFNNMVTILKTKI